ncbi:hypothetical protein NVV31_23150 [Cytobacillus firmus]|uniref:hypothetical protein n=1 Tax=Cytobacillus firmus TaxID=1399 RepID=UPI0021C9558A|nr:hypothetical protein [Cytobacillus firmus]MCU1808272.1 hypothetical protein [Cytobacillus firmus]
MTFIRKIKYFIVFPLLGLLLGVIWNLTNSTYSISTEKEVEETGIILGYFDKEHSLTNNQLTHVISNVNHYKPQIEITNNFPDKSTYSLYFYLDYEQIAIEFGKKNKSWLELEIGPYETKKLNIGLPDIKNGRHDFIVIASRDSEINETTNPYLNNIARKTTIIKSKDSVPIFSGKNYKEFEHTVADPNLMFTSKKPTINPHKMKNFIEQNSKYWLNIPTNSVDFALIAMLGNKQIELDNKFIKNEDLSGYIHFPLEINNTIGTPQDFIVFSFEQPFESMENNKGEILEFHNYSILNTVRVE